MQRPTPHCLRHLLPLLLLLTGCGLEVAERQGKTPGEDSDSQAQGPDSTADDSGSQGTENRAPIADAGEDVETAVDAVVNLDGSGSSDPDDDPLSFAWDIQDAPAGSTATILNDDRMDPMFAPDLPGDYSLRLVVYDGEFTDEDSVAVVALSTGDEPVAVAGADQAVGTGDTVLLDGSSSYDPDGDALLYAWTLTGRPTASSAALTRETASNPSFVADVDGLYEVTLVVSDGVHESAPDTVRVSATATDSGDSSCGCARRVQEDLLRRLGVFLFLPSLWTLRRRRP